VSPTSFAHVADEWERFLQRHGGQRCETSRAPPPGLQLWKHNRLRSVPPPGRFPQRGSRRLFGRIPVASAPRNRDDHIRAGREGAPSIYYGLGYAILLGIVHRMLPWRPATQALDSTVTFLNTTDCRTGRRARQPRTAQIPISLALCWCIAHRSKEIPAIVGGRLPTRRLRAHMDKLS
jgi:hypothetical protein